MRVLTLRSRVDNGGYRGSMAPMSRGKLCVQWLIYSVLVALAPIWLTLFLSLVHGHEVIDYSAVSSTLLVFALVLIATSFGHFYPRIVELYGVDSWSSILMIPIAGFLFVLVLLAYTPSIQGSPIPLLWSSVFALAAIVFGKTALIMTLVSEA